MKWTKLYYPDVHDPVDGDAHAADRRVGEHEVGKAAVADAKSPLIHLKSSHPFEDLGQCQAGHQLEGKSENGRFTKSTICREQLIAGSLGPEPTPLTATPTPPQANAKFFL